MVLRLKVLFCLWGRPKESKQHWRFHWRTILPITNTYMEITSYEGSWMMEWLQPKLLTWRYEENSEVRSSVIKALHTGRSVIRHYLSVGSQSAKEVPDGESLMELKNTAVVLWTEKKSTFDVVWQRVWMCYIVILYYVLVVVSLHLSGQEEIIVTHIVYLKVHTGHHDVPQRKDKLSPVVLSKEFMSLPNLTDTWTDQSKM